MTARNAPAGGLISVLSGLVIVVASGLPAAAQGSGSSRLGQPGSRQPSPGARSAQTYRQPYQPQARPGTAPATTPEAFSLALWRFLVRPQAPYTAWPPLPGKQGPRPGQSPHGASVRLYANATAQADPQGLPPGSILVLEDYSADQKVRSGINILYRVKGYDPKNGDWYWMKYLEDGTLARTAPTEGDRPIAGRVNSCIDCHRKAGGSDFVFSNDPAERPAEEKPAEKKSDGGGHGRSAAPRVLLGRAWPASGHVPLGAVDHRPWDALLKRHVDTAGRVDYAAWRRSAADFRALDGYLDALSRADPGLPADRDTRLAFWINAYNALTVRGILRAYPAASNRDRDRTATTPGDDDGDEPALQVGGRAYTLGEIENQVLRPLGDPRVHFAIVCGARGCPRLLNEGYTAAGLEGQLARNARAFFADPSKFAHDPTGDRFSLSAILDWYADDFGKTPAERLRTIAPYLPDGAARHLAERGTARVSFLEYDRGLNDRAAGRSEDVPEEAVDGRR